MEKEKKKKKNIWSVNAPGAGVAADINKPAAELIDGGGGLVPFYLPGVTPSPDLTQ